MIKFLNKTVAVYLCGIIVLVGIIFVGNYVYIRSTSTYKDLITTGEKQLKEYEIQYAQNEGLWERYTAVDSKIVKELDGATTISRELLLEIIKGVDIIYLQELDKVKKEGIYEQRFILRIEGSLGNVYKVVDEISKLSNTLRYTALNLKIGGDVYNLSELQREYEANIGDSQRVSETIANINSIIGEDEVIVELYINNIQSR